MGTNLIKNSKFLAYLIAGIVLIAFAIRVYGINVGLPHIPLHVDERAAVQSTMEIGEGLNPAVLCWPGTLYMFILSRHW